MKVIHYQCRQSIDGSSPLYALTVVAQNTQGLNPESNEQESNLLAAD